MTTYNQTTRLTVTTGWRWLTVLATAGSSELAQLRCEQQIVLINEQIMLIN